MADFLLVHDIGQGAWAWGKVWGYLTAPVEHPPRLAVVTAAGRVVSPDLPYHPTAGLDSWVTSVTEAISSHGLRDLVLVAHGVAAPVALQVAAQLETPPKRVVMLAGVIPKDGKSPLSTLPLPFRLALKNPLARGNMKIPKALITYYLCNNMDPMDIIQIVGRFMPVPAALLRSRLSVSSFAVPCPVTYAVLWRDRLLSPELQRAMADRLEEAEVVELNSCHEVTMERPKEIADLILRYA